MSPAKCIFALFSKKTSLLLSSLFISIITGESTSIRISYLSFNGSLETLYEEKKLSLFAWTAPGGDADRIVLEAVQASQPREEKDEERRQHKSLDSRNLAFPWKTIRKKSKFMRIKHPSSEQIFCQRHPAVTAERWAVHYRSCKCQVFLLVSLLFGYISNLHLK